MARAGDAIVGAVGLEPACVKTCPTGAIVFGSKDDMKEHAAERIVDLKSRGFDNAGLYDPEGVGGTHVMYVLHMLMLTWQIAARQARRICPCFCTRQSKYSEYKQTLTVRQQPQRIVPTPALARMA